MKLATTISEAAAGHLRSSHQSPAGPRLRAAKVASSILINAQSERILRASVLRGALLRAGPGTADPIGAVGPQPPPSIVRS